MLTRSVVPSLGHIAPAVGWVDEVLAEAGLPAEVRADVQVCVEEALANLVLHGASDQDIRLAIGVEAGVATVVIMDRCRPFDPAKADFPPAATLENEVVGGAGLRLMRGLATSLSYESAPEGNTLTMTFAPEAADQAR